MTKARQSSADKARQSAGEKAKLDALLKEKIEGFMSRMQAEESRINFDHVSSDCLLVIEALNEWSGGALSEGGDVLVTSSGDDPACATMHEWGRLLLRILYSQQLIYPVSSFVLTEDQKGIDFNPFRARYRLQAHIDGSRMSAINIAREKHITDVDACHQLWLMCATEDCMAYLQVQMELHSLKLAEEDCDTTRRLVAGFLLDQMSPGQVWNAMWRTVRKAAAMSTRPYYNSTKAAALIPKYLDQVLAQAMGDITFESYGRLVTTPVGAMLMLFRTKFGVDDTTPGRQVRAALAADAQLAPPSEDAQPEEDEPGERTLVQGTFYFNGPCEEIDTVAMSCFQNIRMETTEIDWPSHGGLGRWDFTADENYLFNSEGFIMEVLKLLDIDIPVFDQATCSALPTREEKWEFEKRYHDEVSHLLMQAGVSKFATHSLSYGIGHSLYGIGSSLRAGSVVSTLRGLPITSGLAAIRLTSTTVHSRYSESEDYLAVEHFKFDIPDEHFGPTGFDPEMVKSILSGDMDSVARMLADATRNSIRAQNSLATADLLEKVAQQLFEDANRIRDLQVQH